MTMKPKKKQAKTKTISRKIDTGTLHRTFTLDRAKVDEENRTIPLSFSSEEPVERWFGNEVLSHDPAHVDLGRLNDGGALLVDHDPRDHVGVVEEASIGSDKKGRAVVRFGQSKRAKEIFQDVLDEIRSKISVGYRIHEMLEDRDTNTFTATRWSPHEISFVSIPADVTVGVGRSEREEGEKFETTVSSTEIIPNGERVMKLFDEHGNEVDAEGNILRTAAAIAATKTPAKKLDAEAERKEIRKAEGLRTKEIRALGKEHGQETSAELAVDNGTTLENYRVDVLNCLRDTPASKTPTDELGLTHKEAQRFSYCKAIMALANPQSRSAQEAAGFEIECSNAVAQQRGTESQGFFIPEMTRSGFVNTDADGKYVRGISVPLDVQRADLNATTDSQGGYLVDTNLMSGSFIDVLRNMTALGGMGATMMGDLVGDIAIPGKLAAGTSAWLATEGANAVQSDMTFRQVAMTPKTAATYTEFTRQLMMQSSVDVDALVRNDIASGMALLLDLAGLYGTGSSGQPTGIATTTGIGDPTTWAAAVPTWAEVVALESNIAGSNALMGSLGYLMETAMRGSLKTKEKATNTAQFIMSEGQELNGYSGNVSNQVVSGDIFFGNWADMLIGLWGGMDLLIDPYTNSLSGTIRVVAHQSMDVAVRHAASFALGNDTV